MLQYNERYLPVLGKRILRHLCLLGGNRVRHNVHPLRAIDGRTYKVVHDTLDSFIHGLFLGLLCDNCHPLFLWGFNRVFFRRNSVVVVVSGWVCMVNGLNVRQHLLEFLR